LRPLETSDGPCPNANTTSLSRLRFLAAKSGLYRRPRALHKGRYATAIGVHQRASPWERKSASLRRRNWRVLASADCRRRLRMPASVPQGGFIEFLHREHPEQEHPHGVRAGGGAVLRVVRRRNLELTHLQPSIVAAYIELLQETHAAPSVKQHLAAIRMLFDYLVLGHVLPMNPASAVRGPKHTVRRGKTPVLTADQARLLLDSIDTSSVVASGTGRLSASWSIRSPASPPSSGCGLRLLPERQALVAAAS